MIDSSSFTENGASMSKFFQALEISEEDTETLKKKRPW